MKHLNYYITGFIIITSVSCSEKTLDGINENLNDPSNISAVNVLPSAIVESSFGTTGTDLAWYSSVAIEHSAGGDEQFYDFDRRRGASASSLVNNSWNAIYDNLMMLNDIIVKCSPGGVEAGKKGLLGMAQILTAYNLAIATDMWGQVPWTQAIKGAGNPQPIFDKQQDIYRKVLFTYLNTAIGNLKAAAPASSLEQKNDLIYGGNRELWIKAAWSLKARYFMHMQKVEPTAVDSVLACVVRGFENAGEAFIFNKYDAQVAANPWYDFNYLERGDLVISETLFNLMENRFDPRMDTYFEPPVGSSDNVPAPSGEADQSRAWDGIYSFSRLTGNEDVGATLPTPLMSFHELKFLQAEALLRKGLSYTTVLQEAVEANFSFHGTGGGTAYYTNKIAPLLTGSTDNKLKELLTQKYIAFFEAESIEAYNDYRRTGVPQLNNPANSAANFGFLQRYPYASSELSSNRANVPVVNVFKDKIWWAGGTE